jgi:hypothetical protein
MSPEPGRREHPGGIRRPAGDGEVMTDRRPLSRSALVLLALSVLAGAGATAMLVRAVYAPSQRPVFAVPGAVAVAVDSTGAWAVFVDDDALGGDRGYESVHVTGPGGETVTVDRPTGTQTIGRDEGTFTAVAQFEAGATGTYRVELTGGPTGEAFVDRDTFSQLLGAAPWLAALGLAGLVFFGAGVGLVVSLVRRSRVSG